MECSSAKLCPDPLTLFGKIPMGSAGIHPHARDDAPAPAKTRRDIVDETRQGVAAERLALDSRGPRWLGPVVAFSAHGALVVRIWLRRRMRAMSREAHKAAAWAAEAIRALPWPERRMLWWCLSTAAFAALALLPDLRSPPTAAVSALAPPAMLDPASAPSALASAPAVEDKPREGTSLRFTAANLRYCIFQQVRLEAIGPVAMGAEMEIFTALIADWNSRCARFRYVPSEKDAVDAEVRSRRALLEAEGRELSRGWQRQIETALARPLNPAQPSDPPAPAATGQPAMPASTRPDIAADTLPPLIVLGRSNATEPSFGFNPLVKTPSLVLLRPEAALRVQERLNELGYTVKPADGTWGPASRAAVRRFKEANGLLSNDGFDIETVVRLFSASAVRAPPLSGPRSEIAGTYESAYPPPPGAGLNPLNRPDALRIQRRLAALGYYSANPDGLWGVTSRRALRSFKAANDLADDDEWDAMTEQILHEDLTSRVAATSADVPGMAPVTASPPAKTDPSPKPAVAPKPAKRTALPLAHSDVPRPPATIPAPSRPATSAAPAR